MCNYVGYLESKERLRIQPAQLFNFSWWAQCSPKDYVNEKLQWHHRESNPRPPGLKRSALINYTTAYCVPLMLYVRLGITVIWIIRIDQKSKLLTSRVERICAYGLVLSYSSDIRFSVSMYTNFTRVVPKVMSNFFFCMRTGKSRRRRVRW